jgi:hypothetical protein
MERSQTRHADLNGRHARPPGSNSLQRQARFDEFVGEFNSQRRTKHSK